ncbi:lachesin-like [Culicoides brevitarsis]|uniref:lachesin-like n=1 Tax=Culicoides brevitarsis TaxID=469753 RepID=UPI00307C2CF7
MARKQIATMDRIILCSLLSLMLIVKGTETSPSSSSRYQDNYIEEDKYTPGFLTLGQKYSIAIGSTVILPCKINETDKPEDYVLAWKKDIAILTAGPVKVNMNPRYRLMPSTASPGTVGASHGYNLEIKDVRTSDAGEYVCQLGTIVPREIVHTLEVMVPPKIDFVSPPSRLDASKNSAIRLECRASGNPQPKIIWTRKNNVMPNGEANVTGNVLEIMHATRHTAGHYRCTADNRVGQTDTREIFVNVLYAPEIEVERGFVHTGVGFEAQLTCVVHAEPQPHVIWYKDTTQLGTTEQHSQQNRGNKYSLIIRNVTHSDLGNYTCQASNSLGRDRGYLTLSGIPSICFFDSPTVGHYRDQYNITWTVQSYSPIREYRLFYRKQYTKTAMYHDKENLIFAGNKYNYGLGIENQWENVVIPEVYDEQGLRYRSYAGYEHVQNTRHRRSFLIKGLVPSTNYEARLQARNDHGWNKLSSIFHFTTASEDVEPSAQPAVGHGLLDKEFFSSSNQLESTLLPLLLSTVSTLLVAFVLSRS